MKIIKVEATNLKGRTFSYELSPAVCIVGDNFTGKSSIIDAIRLPMIGHLPELGKTNAATAQLKSGESMHARVSFAFDHGARVVGKSDPFAEIAVLPNGKVIRSTSAGGGEASEKDLALFSAIPLLNASAYFAMTERERYNYIFEIAKMPEEFSIASIIAECERISFEDEHTETIEAAKTTVIADLRLAPIKNETVQDFLTERVERLKGLFTHWNAREKDTVGAVRVMAELKNRQNAMGGTAQTFAMYEQTCRSTAETAYKKNVELMTRVADAKRYQQSLGRLKNLEAAVNNDEEIKKLEKVITEATGMIKLDPPAPELTDKAIAKLKEQMTVEIGAVASIRAQIETLAKEKGKLDKAKECPYCKASDAHWKRNVERNLIDRIKALESEAAKQQKISDDLKSRVQAAEENLAHYRDYTEHNRSLKERIANWQQQIDSLKARKVSWEAELVNQRKGLGEEILPPSEEDLRASEQELEARRRALAKATENLKLAESIEQDIQRQAQAKLEHEKAVAMVKVIKCVRQTLEDKKAALVDLVFGDLLKVANGLTDAILEYPLAFHEGEVGYWRAGRWVSHKTFSGTEQALTFVAIAAALSQKSPIKLLIFDELGRLDEGNRSWLLKLLFQAQDRGWIDQFIIAGAVPAPVVPSKTRKLQIIDLNRKETK